jgi:Kef-type K+ transport system membrane component KefB/Trk K+ transport system NAD-binding subunit
MPLPSAFAEIAAILLVAAIVGLAGMRLRQPLIVSLILVGLLVGPAGIGVVTHHEQIELFASVGIALLLFVVGLKLDLQMIRTVGPAAVATGLGQVVVTAAVGYGITLALGFDSIASLYIAVALTFSSTIIVVKLLSDKREIDALHGRLAVGVLIVQDLCVIGALIALTAVGSGSVGAEPSRLQTAVTGIVFVSAVFAAMRWLIPAVARAMARSMELLVLFGIAWAVALSAMAEGLGFSREVGAFLAGVTLASTPYRDAIGARLATVRDFLLLFFFIDLGSRLDISQIGATLRSALLLSLFVLVGKPLIVAAIMGVMGYRKRTGFLTGLTIAQISEFSLILGALGVSLGHITDEAMGVITTVGLVTITLSTYLIMNSAAIYGRLAPALTLFERRTPYREAGRDRDPAPATDVVLFGLGRYGGSIVRHLLRRNRRVTGVDFDPEALARWRAEGLQVVYGDAADPELFEHLPLDGVKWAISTTPDLETNRLLLKQLAHHGYTGRVAIACRSAQDAEALESAGADLLLRPFLDAAEQAADAITSASERLAAVASAAPGLREVRLSPGSVWAGRRLGDVPLSTDYDVTVLAVSRSGRSTFNPGPDMQLFPGDRLVLSGDPDQIARAVDFMARVEFADDEQTDVAVEELTLSDAPAWVGRSIAELDLRHRFGVSVVAVGRGPKLAAPQLHTPLGPDDRMVVAGRREDIDRARTAGRHDGRTNDGRTGRSSAGPVGPSGP